MPLDPFHYATPTKPNRLLFRILRTVANLPLFGMSARIFLQKALRCGKNLKESPSAEVSISLRSLLISFGSGPPRESSGVAPRAARLVPSSAGVLLILVLFRRQVYVCECRARTQLGGSRCTVVCSTVHSHGRFRRRHSSQHLRGIRPCVQTTKRRRQPDVVHEVISKESSRPPEEANVM